jgi:hypothetical protein
MLSVGQSVKLLHPDGAVSDFHGVGKIEETTGKFAWVRFPDHSYCYPLARLAAVEQIEDPAPPILIRGHRGR